MINSVNLVLLISFNENFMSNVCVFVKMLFLESVKSTPSITQTTNQMKKIYAFLFASAMAFAANAQVLVAFTVDMSDQTVSPNGVHLAGNFNDPNYDGSVINSDYAQWSPNSIALQDLGNGIYGVELNLLPAQYQFKFINGNDWPGEEQVPDLCRENGTTNRYFWVSEESSYDVCFGGCVACGDKAVLLQVDMSLVDLDGDGITGEAYDPNTETGDIHPDGVHVAGDFPGSGWTSFVPLQDNDGNGIWTVVLNVGDITGMEYKFINGPDFNFPNENISGACGPGNGNRSLSTSEMNTIQQIYCYNACDFCVQPSQITFNVDMNNSCADVSEGINLMGTVTNWGAGEPMSDDDGDGIYTLTLPLQPGNYAYKFRIGGGGWEGFPGDRSLTVEAGADQTLPNVCFGSADPCGAFYAPADVTFRVNPGDNVVPQGHILWVMGDFTGWQGGALEMTEGPDGVWEKTITEFCPQQGFYKFVIGLDNLNTATDWLEETADFSSIGGCGVDNGTFSDNRNFVRTSDEAIELCYTFDECSSCLINVEENEAVSNLSIFPVPANDVVNVRFNNLNAQTVVINLVNNVGQVVRNINLGTVTGVSNVELDVNNLTAGVYAVQISNGNTSVVRQIVVQ